jgi:hypothetical protein
VHGEKEDDQDLFKVPQFPAKPYNYKKVRQSHHLFFSNFLFVNFSLVFHILSSLYFYIPKACTNWQITEMLMIL